MGYVVITQEGSLREHSQERQRQGYHQTVYTCTQCSCSQAERGKAFCRIMQNTVSGVAINIKHLCHILTYNVEPLYL